MWLFSTLYMVSATEELILIFYLILDNLNLNSHLQIMATVLSVTGLEGSHERVTKMEAVQGHQVLRSQELLEVSDELTMRTAKNPRTMT